MIAVYTESFPHTSKIVDSMVSVTRRTALQGFGIAAATSLAGCAALNFSSDPTERPPDSIGTSRAPPTDEWRFPRAGLLNTSRTSRELRTRPTVAWQKQQEAVRLDEAESGDVVAATTDLVVTAVARDADVILYTYDAANGDRRWRRQIQYPPGRRYPRFGGLVDETLFLTDSGTDVIAVDVADGTVRWRVNLYERVAEIVPDRFLTGSRDSPDQFSPVPLATPDTVYIQSSFGLHGLAPADGREQWRIYLGDHDHIEDTRVLEDPGGLAVTGEQVWASYGEPTPSIYAVEMVNGSPTIDRVSAPLDLPGRPVVASNGGVTVASQVIWSTDAHRTLAFGAAEDTGVTWQFPGLAGSGPAAFSSVATDGERVFVCEGHESQELFVVFALDASTGGLEWLFRESLVDRDISVAAPAEFRLSQPVVGNDTVVVGYGVSLEETAGQGLLIALSSEGGRVRWRTSLSIAPRDVAVAGDRVYVSGREKGVIALTVDGGG